MDWTEPDLKLPLHDAPSSAHVCPLTLLRGACCFYMLHVALRRKKKPSSPLRHMHVSLSNLRGRRRAIASSLDGADSGLVGEALGVPLMTVPVVAPTDLDGDGKSDIPVWERALVVTD